MQTTIVKTLYIQLSVRQTPLRLTRSVRLRAMSILLGEIKGVKKGRDQLLLSVLLRCPLRESRQYWSTYLHHIYHYG